MAVVMSIIVALVTIVSLVCWVMILIKIFKENVGLGILGIVCSLFAFIYGWVKVKEYDAQKIMVVWTIATVVGILAQLLGAGAAIQEILNQTQGM